MKNEERRMKSEKGRKRVTAFIFFLFAFSFFILFGCKNIMNDPHHASRPGYGRVVVTIKGALKRTVFPMMAFAKYEYLFAKIINGQTGEPEELTPENGYYTLEYGDWQVTVKAYLNKDDAEPVAEGISATFPVRDTAIAQVTVQLTGNDQTGSGTFIYSITFPNDAQIIDFKLENLLDENAAAISISGSGETGYLSGTVASVPAGYYYLTIRLMENGPVSRRTGANEVVYIYDKLDSEYERTFTEEDFAHIHEWGGIWGHAYTLFVTETEDGLEARECILCSFYETRILYATGTPGLSFEKINYPVPIDAYRVRQSLVSGGVVHIPAMHRPDSNSQYLPVIEIAGYAFQSSSISSITIPASVTTIGERAFGWNNSLSSITVDVDNPSYTSESSILYNKAKTQIIAVAPAGISGDISIPAGVTSIGEYTFQGCNYLTGITLPDSVTSIGNYAFQSCTNLAAITIPAGVTNIGEALFSYCNNLAGITVDANNSWYLSENNILYNKAKTQIIAVAPAGISGTLNIPSGVTTIGNSAFSGCGILTDITFPASVRTIGDQAFSNCYNLASINIPSGVTSIGSSAFQSCYSLADIALPASVTTIGYGAFSWCNSLTGIFIPAGVTSIGEGVFNGCNNLATITVDANNPNYVSEGNILYNKAKTRIVAVAMAGISGNISIPSGVTSIGYDMFQGSSITSITIPASVTNIGNGAFRNCASLAGITVAENNSYYASEGGILYNKAKSTVITVPAGIGGAISISAGVTSIGEQAFAGCSNITGVTLPASATAIGYGAFQGCSSLGSIHIPEGVTSIENSAFENCSSLTNITLPSSLTTIGRYVFYYCTSLADIAIPASITSIEEYAFYNCSALVNITIPASVTDISNYAFQYCNSLTGVTFEGSEITSAAFGSSAFPGGDSLKTAYFRTTAPIGGAGTYTRAANGDVWAKQ